jgi:serine acetyltransferase
MNLAIYDNSNLDRGAKAVGSPSRVFIAPGVEIGSGVIVSAGSVVFESVVPKTLVRGNPATVVSETKIAQRFNAG